MNDMHPLGRLIQDVKRANGWSDERIVERAAKAKFSTSKQNIGRIRNHPVVTVSADQIAMLAAGLGVPEVTVARAAVASMGFPEIDPGAGGLEEVVRTSTDLTAYDKELILTVLGVMRSERSKQREQQALRPDRRRRESDADFRRRTLPAQPDMFDGIADEAAAVEDGVVAGQKTWPADQYDLAAHYGVPMMRDQIDRETDAAGEENQDHEE